MNCAARAWQEHYEDLLDQLTMLSGGRLKGRIVADEMFLGQQRANQQVDALDRIRKDTRAAKERIQHYQTQLSETIQAKEKNEKSLLQDLVNDPTVSSAAGAHGGGRADGPGDEDEDNLQSQVAHLKRTLKARERMDRTARIVSAEAAVELNEMREKLEVAEQTAGLAREQVRNAREQQRGASAKMQDAQAELHRTTDIVQKKMEDIVNLKAKSGRLEDQIEYMAQDSSNASRPRFMRGKKGNDDEVKRLRDDLTNSTSEKQRLGQQLERARLNIKRLERELDSGEVDLSGSFASAGGTPFQSPSMSASKGQDPRRVSWHADDVEETRQYVKGSKHVLGSRLAGEDEEEDSGGSDRKRKMAAKFGAVGRQLGQEADQEQQEEEYRGGNSVNQWGLLNQKEQSPTEVERWEPRDQYEEDDDEQAGGEDEDFLALRKIQHGMGGGGGTPRENPRYRSGFSLEKYRESEREGNLARIEAMWAGCTVLKHSTSRGRSKSRHLQLSSGKYTTSPPLTRACFPAMLTERLPVIEAKMAHSVFKRMIFSLKMTTFVFKIRHPDADAGQDHREEGTDHCENPNL